MFFRRGGVRLSAAAVEQAFILPSDLLQVHVKAHGLEDVICTLRNKYALQRARVLGVPPGFRWKPHEDSKWDTSASSRFITATNGPLAAASFNLHDKRRCAVNGNVRSHGVPSDRLVNNRSLNSQVRALETVLFTSWGGGVCAPRCPTVIMHIRESSTAAAEPKRHPDADEPAGTADKGEVPVVKEAAPPSSSSSSKAQEELEPEEGNPSKTQQLKKVFKEYGAVGVGFHVSISLMSLGMFYLLVSSGIDMAAVLCKLGFSEAMVQSKLAAGTSTFVLAYAVHKLFAPVRISITLVSVPLIVRYFRKTGLFKPPTP